MTNKELDKWIAENVMGWHLVKQRALTPRDNLYWADSDNELAAFDYDWHPTESISDAFQVVEKMDDCLHLRQHGAKGIWSAMFCSLMDKWIDGGTASLAICLAAKKTIER